MPSACRNFSEEQGQELKPWCGRNVAHDRVARRVAPAAPAALHPRGQPAPTSPTPLQGMGQRGPASTPAPLAP